MEQAFPWLLGFVISQFVRVLHTRLPANFWRGFHNAAPRVVKAAGCDVAAAS